jgi:hypothetical protein
MAEISIEVRSGMARFAVAVQAHSIQQALKIVATRSLAALSGRSPRPNKRAFWSRMLPLESD